MKKPSAINNSSQSKSECLNSILVSNNISMIVLEVALQRFCFEDAPIKECSENSCKATLLKSHIGMCVSCKFAVYFQRIFF